MQTASSIGHQSMNHDRQRGARQHLPDVGDEEGKIRMAAARTGGITTANRPIEIVGRPRPIAPFAEPARANTTPDKDED